MKLLNFEKLDDCVAAHRLTRKAFKMTALITMTLASAAAGAATVTTIVPNGMTVPLNGFIANTSLINPDTGLPRKHLWIPDHLQGLCRIDPDLDSPGPFALNPNTCTLGGPVAFDPQNDLVYIAHEVANKTNQGLVRNIYNPAGDGGHGSISAPTRLGDSSSCGVASSRPTGMTLGPDGSLYLTFQKNGNIMRVNGPASASVPCANFQSSIVGNGRRNFGATFVGHDLYILGDASPALIENGDTCSKPGQPNCLVQDVFTDAALVPGGIGSNQIGTTPNGTALFIADITSITKVENVNGAAGTVITNWATGMSNPSSITPDITGLANPDGYISDDPTGGNGQLQGRVFRVSENDTPVAPGAPTQVSAEAGDSQATVTWTPGTTGSATTSRYTVHIFDGLGNGEIAAPQSTTGVNPVPTSLPVIGISNGTTYAFKVEAESVDGTSPLSALSDPITPQASVVPTEPQSLSGITGDAAVALAWAPPANNGGSPIESYTIDYHDGGPHQFMTVPGNVTGTTITGLTNGTPYGFAIFAHNAAGDGPESNEIFLTPDGALPSLNLSLTMAGPTEVQAGANAVYTLFASNTGGLPVDQVRLVNTLPTSGFGSASFTTTRGACLSGGGAITCTLGPMNPGQNATVTVTLTNVTTALANSASVSALDVNGNPLPDAEADVTDNSASVSTTIAPPPPAPEPVTDLQINSASAGKGSVGGTSATSWSLRNGGGDAHNVVLTLTLPSQFAFVASSSSPGCSSGANNTVVCSIGNLLAGAQTARTVSVSSNVAIKSDVTGFANFDGIDLDTNQTNNSKPVSVEFR